MITVQYKQHNNKIILIPTTAEENDLLIHSISHLATYNQGVWEAPVDVIQILNQALIPLKSYLYLDSSFKQFISTFIIPAMLEVGVINTKIYKGSQDIPHKEIEKVCSFFWKPAIQHPKFKAGKWDGMICLYKRWLHEFPTGLLQDVIQVLEKHNIKYNIKYIYNTNPPKQYDWKIVNNIIPDPDQIEAVNAALQGKRGVLKAPTGFGKTAILARYIIANLGVPTLFVANKKALLDDAANEFLNGIEGLNDVEVIKDGYFGKTKITNYTLSTEVKPLSAPVIVATIQSLYARLRDERTRDYLLDWLHNTCKLLIVDECQAIGTKIWDEVLNECYAPYRFFLSATPKRTDGATLKLIAQSGPILYTTTAQQQIEKGRLCELDINYLVYDHKLYNENDADINYNELYRACIVENMDRNLNCIVKPALQMVEEGRHVLILVQLIDHGHILYNMFLEQGLSSNDLRFVWGDTPDSIRKSAIEEFRKGEFKIMIGSTIFDAGVNIPIISGIILAGAGNSDITLIQRIGRGARNFDYSQLDDIPEFMKKTNKKITKVIDIFDANVKFFHKQAKHRYYIACEEFGKDRVHIIGDTSVLKKMSKTRRENLKQINQFEAQLKLLEEFRR